jgi:ADP-heptose:LPS heptosyltransferase
VAAVRFCISLRRRRYDAVILFHHLSTRWGALKFALVSRLTGARVVAGLDNGRGGFLTHAAADWGFGARPEWGYWLDVVAALGIPASETPPVYAVPPAARAAADGLLTALPGGSGRLVALHAGVGGYAPLKQWPAERFVALARRLIAEQGVTILLVGGPEMAPLGAGLARQIGPSTVDLTGRTDLSVLAALLGRCALTIGNDSGVVHLAAAVGCPALALFGPTNAGAWAPYGARVLTLSRSGDVMPESLESVSQAVALRVDEPCSPCYYAGYGVRERGHCPHRNCLHHLTPAAAAAVAGRMLAAG